MKSNFFIFFAAFFLLLISGCDDQPKIPEKIRLQTESILKEQNELEFDEQVGRIEWQNEIDTIADTTIFHFNVVWKTLKGKDAPFKYRTLSLADSVYDVQKYWTIFNNWQSILPIVYSPKNEPWWEDLESKEDLKLSYDHTKLVAPASNFGNYQQTYWSNVSFKLGNTTVICDSLIWNPKLDSISIPGTVSVIETNLEGDTMTILNGKDLRSNSDFSSWKISNLTGSFSKGPEQ